MKDAPMYENTAAASQLSRPATDHHIETKLAIKSQTLSPQEIFVNRPASPSQSEPLILSVPVLSLMAARRESMAHPLAQEMSISSTLVNRSGRRKLTNQVNQYSSVRGMLLSLSDPLLSANELNRIKRYHTVDLNTDLIANFNCNLL